jgi:hypothetical protein
MGMRVIVIGMSFLTVGEIPYLRLTHMARKWLSAFSMSLVRSI